MRFIAAMALLAVAAGAPLLFSILPANTQSRDGALQPSRTPQDAPATDCDTYAASDFDPQRKAKGVPFQSVNSALAVPACQIAVQRYPNSPRLIYQLGRAYQKTNDFSSALVQYRKAAGQGYAIAQYNLGVMYEMAQGVPQNYAEAMTWYRKSAEQGDVGGQNNLGGMYSAGHGVPQSFAEAMNWYRKAADQGDALAQYNLGAMYANGRGVPQNYAEAYKWYRKAAEQGNALAQGNLGPTYLLALGVQQQNDAEAVGVKVPSMPEAERLLIVAVEKARTAYAAGANEMAQGAARPARAKEICAALKDLRVSNWLGEVERLSSNSDGLGVLSIQIAKGISIKTWNIDLLEKTLIEPDSDVFKQAVALRKGQRVTFGGQFFRNPTDCILEGSLTLKGSLAEPEFIFRFSDLAAIE